MNTPEELRELEAALKNLSHDSRPVEIVREFAARLGKTAQRQQVFGRPGALLRAPILYTDALERGLVAPEEDEFAMLQGDVVSTDAAYFMGSRVVGSNRFVVVNSSAVSMRFCSGLRRLQQATRRQNGL